MKRRSGVSFLTARYRLEKETLKFDVLIGMVTFGSNVITNLRLRQLCVLVEVELCVSLPMYLLKIWSLDGSLSKVCQEPFLKIRLNW